MALLLKLVDLFHSLHEVVQYIFVAVDAIEQLLLDGCPSIQFVLKPGLLRVLMLELIAGVL